jgi:hypothetical protein
VTEFSRFPIHRSAGNAEPVAHSDNSFPSAGSGHPTAETAKIPAMKSNAVFRKYRYINRIIKSIYGGSKAGLIRIIHIIRELP